MVKNRTEYKPNKSDARLIIDAPSQNADIYWATGFWAPDPAVYFQVGGRKYLVLRDLEVDRAKKCARVSKVFSYSQLEKEIGKQSKRLVGKNGDLGWTHVLDYLFKKMQIKTILVPKDFGIAYADHLRSLKYKLITKKGPFYEERAIKTAREIRQVKMVMKATEEAMGKAIEQIRKSSVRKGNLYYQGELLTSEKIRELIHKHLMAKGCVADLNTIVASGSQGADPHEIGYGPLKAHSSIILDIFPKSLDNGYYGDITRTVVKGKIPLKLKKMYQAVKNALDEAASMYRPGVEASDIYSKVMDIFKDHGFSTGVVKGKRQGFIHGVGHGLGLDIHEEPTIGSASRTLKPGHLITVEPGLYYYPIGGVRIEDLYWITKKGSQRITQFPYVFEL